MLPLAFGFVLVFYFCFVFVVKLCCTEFSQLVSWKVFFAFSFQSYVPSIELTESISLLSPPCLLHDCSPLEILLSLFGSVFCCGPGSGSNQEACCQVLMSEVKLPTLSYRSCCCFSYSRCFLPVLWVFPLSPSGFFLLLLVFIVVVNFSLSLFCFVTV